MLIDLRTEGINIYFLCPFLGCFCLIGASFSSGQSIFGKYKFLENILVSVSQMLAIIPYLISVKIKNESFMNTEKSKEEKKQLINNNFEEENNIKISQGLCLGAVEFLKLFILNVGSDLFDIKFRIFFMSSNVLFLSFLQKCFLKTRIYRHQIASFIIFFVLDIAFIIIIAFDDLLEYNLMQLIFIFVSNLFFSFEITYEKTILNNKDISFYKLCIYLGIFSFIFNIIASIITTIVEFNLNVDDKYKIYFFNYKYYLEEVDDHVLVEIILIFVFVILNGVYNILQLLTIKYLTQSHVLITYIMLAIYYSILTKFQEIETTSLTLIFSFVFYIVGFFVLFIFLEIILLNFCGINKDITFKIGLQSDVNKYMQSFSADEDDIEVEKTDDKGEKLNEMKERNISASSSELESYENDE
jgi:hypothetical protein